MEILKLVGNISVSDFPERITELIEIKDINEFKTRLKNGGKLILEDAILEIGEINLNQNSYFSIGVLEFTMKNSKIITNGNTLDIFSKKVSMDDKSKIIAFKSKNAPNGNNAVSPNIHGTNGIKSDTHDSHSFF